MRICRLAGDLERSAPATQQPEGNRPAPCVPDTHRSSAAAQKNRVPGKALFGASQDSPLQLLPPPLTSLPCSTPSPLFYSNFLYIFYVPDYQISPGFFPASAQAYDWCHLCSIPVPVLYNTVRSHSPCPRPPPPPPFPIRGPHNPLSYTGNVFQVLVNTRLLK